MLKISDSTNESWREVLQYNQDKTKCQILKRSASTNESWREVIQHNQEKNIKSWRKVLQQLKVD